MAVNQHHDPDLEALIQRAASDVKRVNPQLGAPQLPVTDADFAELERDRRELEHMWDELESQFGGPMTSEPAAHAVDDDRGE